LFPNREWDGEPKTLSVKTRACDNDTPLHIAAGWGDRHAINLLLNAGAEVNAQGDMSLTPLHTAVSRNHSLAAEALLQAGANPDAVDEFRSTPRQRAEEKGNQEMIKLFKKYKKIKTK
jgi:ankyrin repeat protein